jgi:hypothetical protein
VRSKILSDGIANDILHGVKKIADYMRQLGFEMTERRCFDWVAAGRIPHTGTVNLASAD